MSTISCATRCASRPPNSPGGTGVRRLGARRPPAPPYPKARDRRRSHGRRGRRRGRRALLDSGKSDVRPSGVVDGDKVSAHPSQSPPHELIAAGNTALAAYYIPTTVKKSATETVSERTYWLLDRKTGTYVKSPKWSIVAVAPGLKTAAVLERTLPASRIGLLDLATGEVKRWIQVGHKVGGLAFSADGRKLVATTYTQNPDADFHPADPNAGEPERLSSRTGFYVLDVASGKGTWGGVAVGGRRADGLSTFVNNRQDFAPTPDGRYVWAGGIASDEVNKLFYDSTGAEVPAPENGSKYLLSYVDAGMSPDGKRVAGDFAGRKWTTSSYVTDSATGAQTEVHGQQLLAWADDKSLVAWDVGKGRGGEERVPPAARAGHHRQRQGGTAERLPQGHRRQRRTLAARVRAALSTSVSRPRTPRTPPPARRPPRGRRAAAVPGPNPRAGRGS